MAASPRFDVGGGESACVLADAGECASAAAQAKGVPPFLSRPARDGIGRAAMSARKCLRGMAEGGFAPAWCERVPPGVLGPPI